MAYHKQSIILNPLNYLGCGTYGIIAINIKNTIIFKFDKNMSTNLMETSKNNPTLTEIYFLKYINKLKISNVLEKINKK